MRCCLQLLLSRLATATARRTLRRRPAPTRTVISNTREPLSSLRLPPCLSVFTTKEKRGLIYMMDRRFVHLFLRNAIGGQIGFTMHIIAAASLFNPARTTNICAAAAVDKTTFEDAELPSPAMAFYSPCLGDHISWMDFMPLCSRSSEFSDCIIAADHKGRATLYDTALRAVRALPNMHTPKRSPVSVTIGDSLYVMSKYPHGTKCFEALIKGYPPDNVGLGPFDWYWKSLPTPPFVYERPRTSSLEYEDEDEEPAGIRAYTVVGNSSVWYSVNGTGTYCFDTASLAWNKVGEWALPFQGYVEYAGEHGLWFGLSADGNKFCASDLNAAAATAGSGRKTKPVLLEACQDLTVPEEWIPSGSNLVPLGSGKFCIARFFGLPSAHDE